MLTPVVLETSIVQEIARIGELRRPNEACGVLLPFPWRGQPVWELPNRALKPHDSFLMTSEDVVLQLQGWIDENPEAAKWENMTFWHTHPSGNTGPSQEDLDNRIINCGNLVVSLGERPLATWF